MRAIAWKFRIHTSKNYCLPPSVKRLHRKKPLCTLGVPQTIRKNREWDEHLKLVTFSSNTSVHESTKFTPHELVFGKSARIPTSNPVLASDLSETYVDCLTLLFNRLRNSQELISDNLNRTRQRAKHYYNRNVNFRAFVAIEFIC